MKIIAKAKGNINGVISGNESVAAVENIQ